MKADCIRSFHEAEDRHFPSTSAPKCARAWFSQWQSVIPTGIVPDIHRQVELRKVIRAVAPDNLATMPPESTPPSDARMMPQLITTPASVGRMSGCITRTWMDDRAEELRRRRRALHNCYRIIFPRNPLRIVRTRS